MVPPRALAWLTVVGLSCGCVRSTHPLPDSGVPDAGSAGGGGGGASLAGGAAGGGGSAADAGSCGGFGGGSEAYITSATTSYDFGAALVGTTSATAVVTLSIRQTTFATRVVGTDSDEFTATPQGCFPTSAVEFLCPISVTFSPGRAGTASAIVAFNGTANAGFCLPLSGTGVDAGVLELAPPSLAFDAGTGAPSAGVAVTLTNHGSAATGAVSTSLTGTGAAFFELTRDGCIGQTLQPTGSCQLEIRFAPGADAGTHTASLRADSPSAGSAVTQLSGVAATPGMLVLSAGIHDFGSASVDGGGSTFDFVVTNVSGAVADAISMVGITSPYGGDFSLAGDQCSTVALQPAQSCTVTARFDPHSLGVKTATLAISTASATLYATLVGSGQ